MYCKHTHHHMLVQGLHTSTHTFPYRFIKIKHKRWIFSPEKFQTGAITSHSPISVFLSRYVLLILFLDLVSIIVVCFTGSQVSITLWLAEIALQACAADKTEGCEVTAASHLWVGLSHPKRRSDVPFHINSGLVVSGRCVTPVSASPVCERTSRRNSREFLESRKQRATARKCLKMTSQVWGWCYLLRATSARVDSGSGESAPIHGRTDSAGDAHHAAEQRRG